MTTARTIEFRASAQFNPVFRPVNEWRGRYRILKGSAGSGKSVNIAQDYVAKLSDPAFQGANLLVVRKIEETNRDSTFAELQAAIYRMFGSYADRFWKVNLNPLALECKTTGNRIIFRGVKDQRQREKVKSITFKNGKLVWIWCEEATELLSDDVDILDDRLRGNLDDLNPNLFYQITMTFNPVSATHWIKARYFDKADPDVLTHHSTYKTNRFIDPAYFRRMERRKEEDPEGYRVYGLGEWGELGRPDPDELRGPRLPDRQGLLRRLLLRPGLRLQPRRRDPGNRLEGRRNLCRVRSVCLREGHRRNYRPGPPEADRHPCGNVL